MSIPAIINTRFFGPISTILENIAGTDVVERAWSTVGLNRGSLEKEHVFVPYQLQAEFGESAARQTGERHIGALVGSKLQYTDLNIYSDYVLGGPNLLAAMQRGAKALRFIAPVSRVHVGSTHDCLLLRYETGLKHSITGAQHVHEATLFLLIDLARHYIGTDWSPEWVELDSKRHDDDDWLEGLYQSKVRFGMGLPGIAIQKQHLLNRVPGDREPRRATVYGDLRELVRLNPPKTMAGLVDETLKLQFKAGDMSEEAIAFRLGLGRRTIQRRLRTEGTNFRDVQQRFLLQRACALLNETDYSISEIAHALGYEEVNSFRRAFAEWTGLSPTQFRKIDASESSG